MSRIQLLYAKSTATRRRGVLHHTFTVLMRVVSRAFNKHVELTWAGDDGVWHTQAAQYLAPSGGEAELWRVQVKSKTPSARLRFAVRAEIDGKTEWDSDSGRNYVIEVGAGVLGQHGFTLLNLDHTPLIDHRRKTYRLNVAAQHGLHAKRVFVRWSSDGWLTHTEVACKAPPKSRHTNRYGWDLWSCAFPEPDVYRFEYIIGAETESGGIAWDNNFGYNYVASRGRLKVLTLNLHCYQESDQLAKFALIARAIREQDIDIACLQEVGENLNEGRGDWSSNAAKIILDRLGRGYHLHTDWAHIGFDRYREGVAIISRFPFVQRDSGYISTLHDLHSIHSRKAVFTQCHIPYYGVVNLFSAHLSWWEDNFAEQFDRLRTWANEKHTAEVAATIICGDFNIKAGGEGYEHVVKHGDYEDQFLKVTNRATFDKVFTVGGVGWQELLAQDGRIDYVWLRSGSAWQAVAAHEIFNGQPYGHVSDHIGYYVEFELR